MHLMTMTTAAITALLATVSFAAPTQPLAPRSTPVGVAGSFYLFSSTGGAEGSNPALNVATIVANDQGFYINRTTKSYCPGQVECPVGNVTVLQSFASGNLSMDVSVPGGQQVLVDSRNGNLRFTKAGKKNPPTWALTTSFQYLFFGDNHFGQLTFSRDGVFPAAAFGFLACPLKKDHEWIVKYNLSDVTYDSECQAIGLVTLNYTSTLPAAYEYV